MLYIFINKNFLAGNNEFDKLLIIFLRLRNRYWNNEHKQYLLIH